MHTLILHPRKVLVFLGNGTRNLDISVERTHKQAFDTCTTCHLVIALNDRRLLISHVLYLHVELKRHARCRSIDEVLPRLVWYGERLTCHDTQYLHTVIIRYPAIIHETEILEHRAAQHLIVGGINNSGRINLTVVPRLRIKIEVNTCGRCKVLGVIHRYGNL